MLLIAAGCASAGSAVSSRQHDSPSAVERSRWVNRMGGLARCPATEARLTDTCNSLLTGQPQPTKAIRVHLLRSSAPRAYAFPPNRVYVTQGAVDRLPEGELVAAMAHELGHLIEDGHIPPPFALTSHRHRGRHHAHPKIDTRAHLEAEMRADQLGRSLLESASRDAAALPRLLHRLTQDTSLSTHIRQQLRTRAAALTAR